MDESIGMPNLIPFGDDEMPDEIMMCIIMVTPELMPGVNLDDIPAHLQVGRGALAAGIQAQLNCPLEIAVEALRGLLLKMEGDLFREHAARTN